MSDRMSPAGFDHGDTCFDMQLDVKHCFVTVTGRAFFPGTLATVNSVLHFQPSADVWVVNCENDSITEPQAECLQQNNRVHLIDSSTFAQEGRHLYPWELKAYAAHDLCDGYDVLVGIDSDCLLCSSVDDELERCIRSAGFLGGEDGNGVDYGHAYAVYGIPTPSRNRRYMSTSLFFCAVNPDNKRLLRRWTECCSAAEFNGRGPYPGHGDQGVLNAVLYAENRSANLELLPNALWSQHWAYWESIIEFRERAFFNRSSGGERQRAFHCGGAEKFWERSHRDRVVGGNSLQTWPYVWFLAMLFFGSCRDLTRDPIQYLPTASHHLIDDLVQFLPQIFQIYPASRSTWEEVGDPMIDRVLAGVPRALSLGGGSLSELFGLLAESAHVRRFVEIGGYEGGSILALALRFANRDIDFFSVESFMGNLDGTMDGYRLPSRARYIETFARFPTIRARLVPGDSRLAAALFEDGSLDFVFIDGCHETAAVLQDISVWLPKIAKGGILAGDDYGFDSVRRAIDEKLPSAISVTPSGCVWWKSF
jgi:methyltransferase family protein